MTDSQSSPPGWLTCQGDDDCIGVQLAGAEDRGCVHHTTDTEALNRWWTNLREGGPLDARGLTFSRKQLEELLDAAPRTDQDRPRLGPSTFERATFGCVVSRFHEATFGGTTVFNEATFEGDAVFRQVIFRREARFQGARFEGAAGFEAATFEDFAWFQGARFEGAAGFERATFEDLAWFQEARFEGAAGFERATFEDLAVFQETKLGGAGFEETRFEGHAEFTRTTVGGLAWFERASFGGVAGFEGATFEGRTGFQGAMFKDLAGFEEARLGDPAEFEGATFEGVAGFQQATFEGRAEFQGATFEDVAGFEGGTFGGAAGFEEARFQDARFGGATFQGGAQFDRVKFSDVADFWSATFNDASFQAAAFEADAVFEAAAFEADATFLGATFERPVWFPKATFSGVADFARARFEGTTMLGPMLVRSHVSLAHVTFSSRLDLEVATPQLKCNRIRLAGGGHLRVGWATVDLTEAEISEPCILEDGADRLRHCDDLWDRFGPQALPVERSSTVRLDSLRRATVTALALGAVDLRDCRFRGAHGLDQLRVPHAAQFYMAPSPAARRHRQVLVEEISWRQVERWPWARDLPPRPWSWLPQRLRAHLRQGRYPNWQQFKVAEPTGGETVEARSLEATDIAELYRQLRRGREARGDQPGAADFYYGEMEMRRKSPSASWVERRTLDAYWMLSGYALRASRAFLALAIVVAIAMVLLTTGVLDDLTLSEAFWTSLESVVLRASTETTDLTDQARNLTTVLRIVGPVLLALAVLSIRGRVKR